MAVIIIDTDNPQSLEALSQVIKPIVENIWLDLSENATKSAKLTGIMTTEQLMDYFHSKDPKLINQLIKKGLPYLPGRPNKFRASQVEEFLNKIEINEGN